MATVTGLTAARMLAIEAATVVDATIDGSNHLVFTTFGGTQIDVGEILTSFPISSDVLQGIVELATDAETITGTDGTRAVTPLGLAALTANDTRKGLVELATSGETVTGTDDVRAVTPAGLASVISGVTASLAGKQPLDSDLTAIAAISPTNDDVMQRKAGAWVNRTLAQLAADLIATSAMAATDTQKGVVELATTAEATTGTDTVRAVTPAGLKTVADTKQTLDSDLTAIAGLSPTNDDVVQRKSGNWTNRSMSQLATDLMATGEFPNMLLHNGTSYADAETAYVYIGPTDPGSVSNGSVWFDTA